MPNIPITVSEQGFAAFDKAASKIKGIGREADTATKKYLALAKAEGTLGGSGFFRGQGGRGGYAHAGSGGREGSLFGRLREGSRAAGLGRGVREGITAVGALGPAGGALLAVGLAFGAFKTSLEDAAQHVKSTFENVHKWADTLIAINHEVGQKALASVGSGGGFRQLDNMGQLRNYRVALGQGYTGSAEDFAKLGGSKTRLAAAVTAYRLGADISKASDLARGIGENADPTKAGRQIAGQIRGSQVSDLEMRGLAQGGREGITPQLDAADRTRGQMRRHEIMDFTAGGANQELDYQLNKTLDPEGTAKAEINRTIDQTRETLQAMAQANGKFMESLTALGHAIGVSGKSYGQQAADVRSVP